MMLDDPKDKNFQNILLDRMQQMQKDFKLLKASNTRLRNHIKDVEIRGFQEQLNSIDQKLKLLEAAIIEVRRELTLVDLRAITNIVKTWLQHEGRKLNANVASECEGFTDRKFMATEEQIKHSDDPKPLVFNFYKTVDEYCKSRGFKVFVER